MRALAIFALTLTFAGCATAGGSGGQGDHDQNLITRQEILEARATNVWEVVNNLRPGWLQAIDSPSMSGNQAVILVYRDNVRLDGPDALRNLNPEIAAQEIRWLDRMQAASRFSRTGDSGDVVGAIVVVTRSP
jgi:hypothetical protein